ncbi:MAG: hypothetical protein FWE03_00295 [Firmicutes bacterium]|nr:hypothetical protein [Bacillota bacterium]
MRKQRETKTGGLLGRTIFEHYDHELYVTEYEFGQNYTLECEMCKEVLCWSENPRSKMYKVLKDLYKRQEANHAGKIFFSRIGGRYGTLNWSESDTDSIEVYRTRFLY